MKRKIDGHYVNSDIQKAAAKAWLATILGVDKALEQLNGLKSDQPNRSGKNISSALDSTVGDQDEGANLNPLSSLTDLITEMKNNHALQTNLIAVQPVSLKKAKLDDKQTSDDLRKTIQIITEQQKEERQKLKLSKSELQKKERQAQQIGKKLEIKNNEINITNAKIIEQEKKLEKLNSDLEEYRLQLDHSITSSNEPLDLTPQILPNGPMELGGVSE